MMIKKYWKTVAALLVILLSLGTYYGSAFIEGRSFPKFQIRTIQGEEALVKPLVISGNYYADEKISAYFQLTENNFTYRHQQSWLSQLKEVPYSYERRLKEDYSSLVRNFGISGLNVVENEDYIANANFDIIDEWVDGKWQWNGTLYVTAIDKETGKTVKMKHEVDENDYGAPRVRDVKLNGDELIVFSFSWKQEAGEYVEVIDAYVFDLKQKELKEQKPILTADSELASLHMLYDTPHWNAGEYVVIRKIIDKDPADEIDRNDETSEAPLETEHEAEAQVEDRLANETVMRQSVLYAYEMKTGNLTELNLPETLLSREVSWFDGERLYFADLIENDTITVFNAATEALSQLTITGFDEPPIISVYDGYLYAVGGSVKPNNPAPLRVYDIESGELVYEGEILPKDAKKAGDVFTAELYSLYFQY